jgi:hypothetical protein
MTRTSMSDLAYDIEQLWIEGSTPKAIALQLDCPVSMVYDWLEGNNLSEAEDEAIDPAEWDEAFPRDPDYDPYSTVNS